MYSFDARTKEELRSFTTDLYECDLLIIDDLGTEAIRKLTVEELPVIVIVDSLGNNLYESAVEDFLKSQE